MCTFLQKLLTLDVFHHFRTLSDDFFNVFKEKLRRNFIEAINLNCWSFWAFNEKLPIFNKGFWTRMSLLLTTYPDANFEKFSRNFFFFLSLFGTWREVFRTTLEKILAWAKIFSILAKVLRLACQNWKLFVHLSSLKLLNNSKNHRGTTSETFRNIGTFWNLVEHRARIFLLFDKNFAVGDSKLIFTQAERIFGEKTLFLRTSVLWPKVH